MRRKLSWGIGSVSTGILVFAVACSDDASMPEVDAADASPATSPDARPVETPDAARADAGNTNDADADAAIPSCSKQGFCQTVIPSGQVLSDVWGDGTGIVWSVSEQGKILRWDGAAWSVNASLDGALYAVWGASPTDIWVGGASGLFHGHGTSSAALTWTPISTPGNQTAPIRSIWGSSPTNVWAVGGWEDIFGIDRTGRVVHFGGELDGDNPVWTADPIGDNGMCFWRVWGSGENDVWLTGAIGSPGLSNHRGELFRRGPSDAGAVDWLSVYRPPVPFGSFTGAIRAAISFSTSWWVVELGTDAVNGFWHAPASNDLGAVDWTIFSNATIPYPRLLSIWGTGDEDLWIAGDMGFLRHWDGQKLEQASVSTNGSPNTKTFHAVWGTTAGELWAVGDNLAVHHAAETRGQ
ncbi:hypothetical protein AKJ09_02535 [Labilithrix luteola]|uniref:Type IV fimbrial biogenesis protein PilY1 n=1 Tax=Labilithrix luteola TaxID=1391654 RepID=A0A0K1PR67_9BACT|nr:hypothetical protein [Labilithrix luteola]AKU95871.1 hypothetical protein AKJ09_02535 [Labilithrix luteola]